MTDERPSPAVSIYECPDCGHRIRARSLPGACPNCGGEPKNLGVAPEQ
jgi:rubrerythrin